MLQGTLPRLGRYLMRLTALVLVGALLLGFAGCRRERPRPIKIGLLAPYSGREAATGYNVLFAVKLAVAERNRQGGLHGHPIELVAHDTTALSPGQPAVQRGMERFRADPDIAAVLAYLTPAEAFEVARLEARSSERVDGGVAGTDGGGPLLINIGLTPPSLSSPTWVISPLPDEEAVAAAITHLARERLAATSLALVYSSGQPQSGFGLSRAVSQSGVQAGLEVRSFISVEEALSRPYAVAAADVAVFSGDHLEAAKTAIALRRAGFTGALVLSPAASVPEFVTLAREAAVGTYLTALAPYPARVPGALSFVESYRQRWKTEPGFAAGAAYDTTLALLTAMEEAPQETRPDLKQVAAAIAQAPPYEGTVIDLPAALSHPRSQDGVYLYRIDSLSFPGTPVP